MKRSQEGWFSARLLFESVDLETDEGLSLEERIIVVRAESEDAATAKARKMGHDSEEEYVAAAGNRVRWRFRTVADIQAILDDELSDGTEVYFTLRDFSRVNLRGEPAQSNPEVSPAL